MLERLTVGDFAGRLGETFRLVRPDGPPIEIVLKEARGLPPGAGPRRGPFSLVFLGPVQPILPQRIYALENDVLGRLEIFLVPIGADSAGVQYEAIFN